MSGRHPTRREFIQGVAGGVGAAALSPLLAATASDTADQRPNVLLVFSDQHRWQSMSFTETPKVFTPQMKRMKEEGFSASQMISNYPLCSPARAMLLTGRWPHETGVIDNSSKQYCALDPKVRTLGTIFRDAGYDTGYVGKWHLGVGVENLSDFGFDDAIVWTKTNTHWDSRYVGADGIKHVSKIYNARHMTDQFLQMVEKPRNKPFFGVLSWNPPHSDYIDAPGDMVDLYPDDKAMPLRGNMSFPEHRPKELFSERYRGYHAHITAVDRELGLIRANLERLGIAKNTLLIYTSDHGGMVASQGLFGKRVPFAEAIRVPFLAVQPGRLPAGVSSDALYSLIDIAPTVAALAGIEKPQSSSGLDFSSAVLGGEGPTRDSQPLMNIANLQTPDVDTPTPPAELFRGVTTGRYTYAVKERKRWLLFDNEVDRLQQHNRIDDAAMKSVRDELHVKLEQWMKRLDDPFPLPS